MELSGEISLIKTEENKEGKIVIPILGTQTNMDASSIAFKIYEEILSEEGIGLENFFKHH